MLRNPKEEPFDGIDRVGVAATRNPIGGVHVGLLYRSGAEILLCHFPYEAHLRNEHPSDKYLWQTSNLPSLDQQSVADYIRLVSQNKDLPYGFDYQGIYFDSAGHYVRRVRGAGLTCATFIMAVFQSLGFTLLDETTWESRPDDVTEKQAIMNMLAECDPPPDPAATEPFLEDVRYRPEEVAFGVIHYPPTIDFATASGGGALLRQFIRSAANDP
jgi:hypothetical protein